MEFLNPIFLIGLVSAAIPLIIHLSRSRRTKKIRFSTTRFLTDQFLRSYRMSRLKELLLLVARMALCALFAMALAQPFLRSSGRSFLLGGQDRSVVLVIDNSASMAYRENGTTLLDRARRAAGELLDGLQEGDRASIVLAGRRDAGPEALFEEPTPQLGDVRQALDALQAATLGTDLSRAVARAEQLVQSGAADSSREIYVLSDLQDSGWEMSEQEDSVSRSTDTDIFFVSVRPKEPRNLAVTAVQYAASRPMVGVPFSIRPHIRNQSGEVVGSDVELYVDGKKVGQQRVESIQAGRWAAPTFHYTFDSGGWHTGYVQVNDGTLDADNRRWFAFEVLDSIKVLAVNGAPSAVARLDELFFLKAALEASSTAQRVIDVHVTRPDMLASTDLADFPLVILANLESLPPQAVEKLEEFVDRGGSLLVFLGDKANPTFYNQTFTGSGRLHGGLLPGPLRGVEGDPASEKTVARIGQFDGGHVVLAGFQEGDAGTLTSVILKACWQFDPGDAPVLMRSTSGTPLLCERSFGQGHVMLFASTCDRDWTDFPVRPAFLPWIYRLVGYLAQEPMGRQSFFGTGDSVSVPASATEGIPQLLVEKPDGSIGNVGTSGDPSTPLAFADTVLPGIYTMYVPGKNEKGQVFVANLEAYESDLTYLDDVLADREVRGSGEALREFPSRHAKVEDGLREVLLPGRRMVWYVDDPARVAEAALMAGRGLKLWDLLLLVALAVALFEPWLANRISLRHYFKPREISRAPSIPGGRLRTPSRLGNGRPLPAEQGSESDRQRHEVE